MKASSPMAAPHEMAPYAFLSSGTADRAALAISNCARAARSALTLSAGGAIFALRRATSASASAWSTS